MSITALTKFSSSISPETVNELVKEAKDAMGNSYSPYSHYPVGAAILMESGKIFSGCNVENAVYGDAMCAERVAVFKAVSEGNQKIKAVAIVLGKGGSPCGACRQVINEFGPDAYVFSANRSGVLENAWKLSELLPCGFGPSNLTQ